MALLRRARHRIGAALRALRRRRPGELLLLIEAVAALAVARTLLTLTPFQQVAANWRRVVAAPVGETVAEPVTARIAWALNAASRGTPWHNSCLVQAIAGRWMLLRRGLPYVLYFGILKDESGVFKAHAWLQSGTRILTGGRGRRKFTVVSIFGN